MKKETEKSVMIAEDENCKCLRSFGTIQILSNKQCPKCGKIIEVKNTSYLEDIFKSNKSN